MAKNFYSLVFISFILAIIKRIKNEALDLEDADTIKYLNITNYHDTLTKYKNILIGYYFHDTDISVIPKFNENLQALAKELLEFDPTIYFANCKAVKDLQFSNFYPKQFSEFGENSKDGSHFNFVLYTEIGEQIKFAYGKSQLEKFNIKKVFRLITSKYISSIQSLSELDRFVRKNSHLTIIHFTDNIRSKNTEIYMKAARSNLNLRQNIKYLIANSSIASKYNKKAGDIVIKKRFDEQEVTWYDEDYSEGKILGEIILHYKPMYVTYELVKKAMDKGIPMFIGFRNENHPKRDIMEKYIRIAYTTLRKDFKKLDDEIIFMISGFTEQLEKDLAELCKIGPSDHIHAVLVDVSNESELQWRRYSPKGDFNDKNIIQFIKDFKEKKLQPYFQSQPENLENGTALNQINFVVGNSFERDVIKSNHHAVIYFFKEDCDACYKIYDEFNVFFTNNYELNPFVFFGVFNYGLNDNYYVSPQGFPEIYLFKSGEKEKPIQYTEKFDPITFGEFLNKNIGYKLKSPTGVEVGDQSKVKKDDM